MSVLMMQHFCGNAYLGLFSWKNGQFGEEAYLRFSSCVLLDKKGGGAQSALVSILIRPDHSENLFQAHLKAISFFFSRPIKHAT